MKRIQTGDTNLTLLQSNVEEAISEASNQPFANGVLIKDVLVTSGGIQIAHKLGQGLTGYFIIRKNANAVVWDTSADNKFLNLSSSGNCTISLWVF